MLTGMFHYATVVVSPLLPQHLSVGALPCQCHPQVTDTGCHTSLCRQSLRVVVTVLLSYHSVNLGATGVGCLVIINKVLASGYRPPLLPADLLSSLRLSVVVVCVVVVLIIFSDGRGL